MNKIFITCLVILSFSAKVVFSQDMHFNPVGTAPLYINPAFTGMFAGNLRISALYENQWGNISTPYITYGLSADMPLLTTRGGSYVGAGIQIIKDQAGDGSASNFNGLASVAYHQLFGKANSDYNYDLSIGLQGGYSQKSVDLTTLYFGNQFNNPIYSPYSNYHFDLGNSVNYYTINTGISFSQSVGSKFNYTVGLAANNLNQPKDATEKTQNEYVGNNFGYTATIGANIALANRLMMRPAILFQFGNSYSCHDFIGGTELQYTLANGSQHLFFKNLFIGAWYRSGDYYSITAGSQFYKTFRLAVDFDFSAQTAGSGGMQLQLQYVLLRKSSAANKMVVPCNRF